MKSIRVDRVFPPALKMGSNIIVHPEHGEKVSLHFMDGEELRIWLLDIAKELPLESAHILSQWIAHSVQDRDRQSGRWSGRRGTWPAR